VTSPTQWCRPGEVVSEEGDAKTSHQQRLQVRVAV